MYDDGSRDYNSFRWYRSRWGRYTRTDPLGLSGDLNLYRYAAGTPIAAIDRLGLQRLYLPRPTPENFAPPGCSSRGWVYTRTQEIPYRSVSMWRLQREQHIEIGSERDPESHAAIGCLCTYVLVGTQRYIERWDYYTRSLCCEGNSRQETTRRLNGRGPLPLEPDRSMPPPTRTIPAPAGEGLCNCPEELAQ